MYWLPKHHKRPYKARFIAFSDFLFFVSVAKLSGAIFVGRREANACLIMLSTKRGSH